MLGWTFAHGTSVKLKRENLGPPMIAGFLMFLQIGTFTLGVHMSNASHGSIFINTFIFWVVGIEHFVTKEKSLSIRNSVGLILAAAGVLLILKSAEKPPGVVVEEAASIEGDLLLLLSALLLGIKISWTKHSLKTIHPDCFIFWHHVFGVILFAIYGAFVEKSDPRILTELSREDVRAAWINRFPACPSTVSFPSPLAMKSSPDSQLNEPPGFWHFEQSHGIVSENDEKYA